LIREGGNSSVKKRYPLLLILGLLVLFSHVGDSRADDEKRFWENLRRKIERITPPKKPNSMDTIAEAGGAKSIAVEDLYWKDKEGGILVSRDELEQFKLGVQSVDEGRADQAREIFEQFIEAYAGSPLCEDARQAVAFLKVKEKKTEGSM